MSHDGKTPEEIQKEVLKRLRDETVRRDPARIEMAFMELMRRYHPVAKMLRKGMEAAWLGRKTS